jgi:hypothetical protein
MTKKKLEKEFSWSQSCDRELKGQPCEKFTTPEWPEASFLKLP